MAKTVLGKVGITPRLAWSNSVADYEYLDTVEYNGSGYVVILKTGKVPAGTLPTNETYFQQLVKKGDKGDQGIKGDKGDQGLAGISKIPAWVAGVYAANTSVQYLGKYWTSNAATVAGDIPGTSAKWAEDLNSYTQNPAPLEAKAYKAGDRAKNSAGEVIVALRDTSIVAPTDYLGEFMKQALNSTNVYDLEAYYK